MINSKAHKHGNGGRRSFWGSTWKSSRLSFGGGVRKDHLIRRIYLSNPNYIIIPQSMACAQDVHDEQQQPKHPKADRRQSPDCSPSSELVVGKHVSLSLRFV